MKTIAILLLAILPALHIQAANTNTNWSHTTSLKAALLHSSAQELYVPAVKYKLGTDYNGSTDFRSDFYFRFLSEGAIALDHRANTENLFAEVSAGYMHDWYHSPSIKDDPSNNATERPDHNLPIYPPKGERDNGRFEFTGSVRFETDQVFNNYNLTIGPRFGYHNFNQTNLSFLIPSLYLEYTRVETLHSRQFRDAGIAEEAYWRLGGIAYWQYEIGEYLFKEHRYLKPLELAFDLRYYQSYELPAGAKAAGYDTALYMAGTVGYELTKLHKSWIRNIFVTVSHGHLPPAGRDQTSVMVGVAFGSTKLKRPERK